MADKKTIRIFWWEPRWSFVPREIRVLQSAFSFWPCLRIFLFSAVAVVPIAFLANAFMPGFQFNWFAAFAISVSAIVGFSIAFLILITTIPPLIFITEQGIGWWWPVLMHEGFIYIKRSELKSVTLTMRDDDMHYLRFRTKRLCKRFGLSRSVNLENLLELMGESLIARDRRRFSKLRDTKSVQ